MEYIYLDNSATTRLSDAAKGAILDAIEKYGNPSSVHSVGLEANRILSDSRSAVCEALGVRGARSGELIFTGGGSEATNLALRGAALAKKRRGADVIITTDSEHPSVDNTLKDLENYGFKTIRIPTNGGVVDLNELDKAINENKVFMITMMLVNNETGAVYDVKRAFSAVKGRHPDAITHCDAVQGFMKVRFTPASLGADMVTLSAHKIHGPKGVGALYVNSALIKAKKIVPIIYGGGQESGYRSGTENLIGIAGFAAAVREEAQSLDSNIEYMTGLRTLAEKLLTNIGEITLNIPQGQRAPHILNITLPHIKSETMLHYLSSNGICVSAGSACSAKGDHPSAALLAFGLSHEQADTSLRISFSRYNTEADIRALTLALDKGIHSLIRIKQ